MSHRIKLRTSAGTKFKSLLPSHEAVTLFRRCTSNIDIVVSRMMEIKPQNNISPLSQYHGHVIETSGNGLWEEPFMLEHKTLLSNGD